MSEPEGELTPMSETLDLQQAGIILLGVVKTDEHTFIATSPLDKIGGYSVNQVRAAVKVYMGDIMKAVPEEFGIQHLQKTDSRRAILNLSLKKKLDMLGKPTQELNVLTLDYASVYRDVLLANQFPLADQQIQFLKVLSGFTDSRSRRDISIAKLEKNFNLDDYQFAIRGMRWMIANILNWNNPGILMPDQLDNPQFNATLVFPSLTE